MNQTTGRLFDELAKVLTNAAGAAQGMREEVETMLRTQAERILNDLDVVQREEFEAVQEMATKAREENERLSERITDLEAELEAVKTKPKRTTSKARSKPKPKS